MREKWLTINDFPNYEVSDKGRVRNKVTNKLMGLFNHKQFGYKHLSLYTGNGLKGRKRVYVHRLVLQAFKPTSDKSLFTNHIDCNPANNNLENLEWCTQKQNVHHSIGLRRYHNGFTELARKRSREVTSKRVMRSDGKIFPSMSEAARSVGGVKESVSACCLGRQRTHKGYSFSLI